VAPYREKVLLSDSGTVDRPVRFCGVPGPKGELPILDGENATTLKTLGFGSSHHEPRGLITVSPTNAQRWGVKPNYVLIEGLELRNAYQAYSFTDRVGATKTYTDNAACVFVERGEHIALRGNRVHGCGNGLFVASSGDEAQQSRDILMEGNSIYGNGTTSKRRDRHHNVYTEAIGMVFQFNHLGPLRDGSAGHGFKDRSAGTVVRYNWIEGGARLLDLVEPEDSIPNARKEPTFRQTYVYGNVLLIGKDAASRPIHYGGDNGDIADYRKGTLFFYHNTVVLSVNEVDLWNTSLIQLETQEESAELRNNIIYSTGTTHLTWGYEQGTMRLGVNWVNRPVPKGQANFKGKFEFLDGTDRTVVGTNPGFVDAAAKDFCLAPSSPARRVAGPLFEGLAKEFAVTLQYRKHLSAAARADTRDLGALACP
jgi:hypothetical protein